MFSYILSAMITATLTTILTWATLQTMVSLWPNAISNVTISFTYDILFTVFSAFASITPHSTLKKVFSSPVSVYYVVEHGQITAFLTSTEQKYNLYQNINKMKVAKFLVISQTVALSIISDNCRCFSATQKKLSLDLDIYMYIWIYFSD